jgi:hypothetical protein
MSIDGNRLRDVVTIESTRGGPQQLGLALHVQGTVRLPDKFANDPNFAKGRPTPFSYWIDVRSASFHEKASFHVEYPNLTLRITFSTPGAFRIWHAVTPDTPPNRRESFYLESEGESVTYCTNFEPVSNPQNRN